MEIRDQDINQLIVLHKISQEKGKLIQIEGYDGEKLKNYATDEIYDKVFKILGCTELAKGFIDILRIEKPRHSKEQCMII